MGVTSDSGSDLTDAAEPSVSITVVVAGVRVEKSLVTDAFPEPAVALSVDSLHDEPVTVRIEETVPASVALADRGSGDWEAVGGGRIAWTGRLDADEERVTTYCVDADPGELADLHAPPTVDSVRPETG
ncbi:hypothetical protein G9464_13155 [Halostella sp. JP-L12]|uniref:hypothetical protein n=2 Tax=Halostella TaxID=1843185 RepID=UPI00140C081C|nr:hypothetical protein [Halostella sp. JP-L12]NHN48534.1 hypothetical protein [Halostella sp. JP-L12]